MAEYKVFRLKENLRLQFRWAPHVSGVAQVKPKDYEEVFTVEAPTPYAAWHQLHGTENELTVGDILSIDGRDLRILKYIGFEEAHWVVPEAKPAEVPDSEQSQAAPVG